MLSRQDSLSDDQRMAAIGLLCFAIAAVVVFLDSRWNRAWDRRRIRGSIEQRGGRILHVRSTVFAPGWSSGMSGRGYRVEYVDAAGEQHRAICRTGWRTGVYFTEDTVTRYEVIRVRDDVCRTCGYSLTGNTSRACPECGTALPEAGASATSNRAES